MSEPSCSTSGGPCNGTQEHKILTKRNWDNFNSWIHCICVVTFDLELGQAVEVNYIFKPNIYFVISNIKM